MAFWGLYGGLEDKINSSDKPSTPSSSTANQATRTNVANNTNSAAKVTQSVVGEPAAKKQKVEVPSGLVPRYTSLSPSELIYIVDV